VRRAKIFHLTLDSRSKVNLCATFDLSSTKPEMGFKMQTSGGPIYHFVAFEKPFHLKHDPKVKGQVELSLVQELRL
jgi:hypothetical protein